MNVEVDVQRGVRFLRKCLCLSAGGQDGRGERQDGVCKAQNKEHGGSMRAVENWCLEM